MRQNDLIHPALIQTEGKENLYSGAVFVLYVSKDEESNQIHGVFFFNEFHYKNSVGSRFIDLDQEWSSQTHTNEPTGCKTI